MNLALLLCFFTIVLSGFICEKDPSEPAPTADQVTTNPVTSITNTGAVSGGTVSMTGTVTARGVCWNTAPAPTTAHSKTNVNPGNGSFTAMVSPLSANTTYYVRAFATSSSGTIYGNERSFTTSAGSGSQTTVTTNTPSGIGSTTAVSGGTVSSTETVTDKGLCWSTAQNPTTSGSRISSGSGAGSFTATISGLSTGSTYYVRAYGQTASGTIYGNQYSFTTVVPTTGAGNWDNTFNTGSGPNGAVHDILVQPDGKVLIAGTFSSVNGTRPYIARLNSDGSVDATFNTGSGFNYYANTLALQPDGKILVGGQFTQLNSVTAGHIIRLNADGSRDAGFNTGSGFNGEVHKILLQPDGRILAAGNFSSFNGTARNNLARLQSTGSLDAGFVNVTNDGIIRSMALQSNGSLLIGGNFTTVSGSSRRGIARLGSTGALDGSFTTGSGFDNPDVKTIAVQSDGRILAGGEFYSYNGTSRAGIIRLLSTGANDGSFSAGTGLTPNGVYDLAIQPDGKIIAVGGFQTYNGSQRMLAARLLSTGAIDNGFANSFNTFATLNTVALQADGKVLVGGSFTMFNWNASNLARLLGN